MAMNFYTIQEAAAKLGVTTEQVRQLVAQGKLSQFRDRDKLMFKREQVDKMAGGKKEGSAPGLSLSSESGAPAQTETDAIELADDSSAGLDLNDSQQPPSNDDTAEIDVSAIEKAGETDGELILEDTGTGAGAVELEDTTAGVELQAQDDTDAEIMALEDSKAPVKNRKETPKSGTGTGINVFEAEEVADTADPMAQTRVIKAIRDEDEGLEADLGTESIGSGSGLLDLTREADDTSLGAAELLDDDAAGNTGTGVASSSAGTIGGLPGSATGAFEGAGGTEVDADAPEGLTEGAEEGEEVPALAAASVRTSDDEDDPIGSGFGGAALLGIFSVLCVAGIIAYTGYNGSVLKLTTTFLKLGSNDAQTSLYYWLGILIGANVVLMIVGWIVGRMIAKRG